MKLWWKKERKFGNADARMLSMLNNLNRKFGLSMEQLLRSQPPQRKRPQRKAPQRNPPPQRSSPQQRKRPQRRQQPQLSRLKRQPLLKEEAATTATTPDQGWFFRKNIELHKKFNKARLPNICQYFEGWNVKAMGHLYQWHLIYMLLDRFYT